MIKLKIITTLSILILTANAAFSAPLPPEPEFIPTIDIQLLQPQTSGGMPLMDALKNRRSDRTFSSQPLEEQTLSDLLWAADGINREDGKRTAPSAMNLQEISIFAIMPQGVYLYFPKGHFLKRIMKEDLRPIVGNAPLTLIYAANLMPQSKVNAAADCGFIGQNVYLFAAANGLNTTFKTDINAAAVSDRLQLRLGQEVFYGQSVGYPPKQKKKQ